MKQCPNPKCKKPNAEDAKFCHICGAKLSSSSEEDSTSNNEVVDGKILDIIKQNSFSKRPLAAYEARKYANQICKKHFGKDKKNYKEYVEMLMAIHYPQELEKSNLGKRYISWLITSIVLLFFGGLGLIVSPIIIWKILVPIYRQLKTRCK